jgi:hypothetical protein
MKRRVFWMSVGAVVVLLGVMQGTAMAKKVIWSAMKGRVLMNGKPAVGAVLKRDFNWAWTREHGVDETTTNSAGEFSFQSIERTSILGSILPHEPVIRQVMTVTYKGVEYNAWANYKHDYDPNTENGGRPIDVTCRLDAERKEHGEVMGLCEFN